MQDYYAARAPEYDRIYLKPERQADLGAIRQWLPTVFKGRSLLEIACGTGYWTQYLAPEAAGQARSANPPVARPSTMYSRAPPLAAGPCESSTR